MLENGGVKNEITGGRLSIKISASEGNCDYLVENLVTEKNNFITERQIKIFSCKDRSMGSKKFLDDFPSPGEKISPKRASQTDRIFSINVHLRSRTSEPHFMCGFVHIAAKPTRFLR